MSAGIGTCPARLASILNGGGSIQPTSELGHERAKVGADRYGLVDLDSNNIFPVKVCRHCRGVYKEEILD